MKAKHSFSISKQLLDEVKKFAEMDGRNLSNTVELLLKAGLNYYKVYDHMKKQANYYEEGRIK